jgi:ferredoxin
MGIFKILLWGPRIRYRLGGERQLLENAGDNRKKVRKLRLMSKVKVTINGIEGDVEAGCTLLEAADRIGAGVAHLCFGNAICSTCRVQVIGSDKGLSPKEIKEKVSLNYHLSFDDSVRLSCQAKVQGPDPVEVMAPKPFKWLALSDRKASDSK